MKISPNKKIEFLMDILLSCDRNRNNYHTMSMSTLCDSDLKSVAKYIIDNHLHDEKSVSIIIEYLIGTHIIVSPYVFIGYDGHSDYINFVFGQEEEKDNRVRINWQYRRDHDDFIRSRIISVGYMCDGWGHMHGDVIPMTNCHQRTNSQTTDITNRKPTLILCSYTETGVLLKVVFSKKYQKTYYDRQNGVTKVEVIKQFVIPINVDCERFKRICEACGMEPVVSNKVYKEYVIDIGCEQL